MKKLVFITLIALLASSTASAQTRRPRASSQGVFNGISGGTVAVGIGVVAAIAAVALIANNSSSVISHSHS